MSRVLVDTGPLVAILSRRDHFHSICVETLKTVVPPLLTCWPVLTEAAWLLRGEPAAVKRLLGSADGSLLSLLPLDGSEAAKISAILERYRQIRPQLADAVLVYLAERERIDTVFTLDRRDFSVFRLPGNRAPRLLP